MLSQYEKLEAFIEATKEQHETKQALSQATETAMTQDGMTVLRKKHRTACRQAKAKVERGSHDAFHRMERQAVLSEVIAKDISIEIQTVAVALSDLTLEEVNVVSTLDVLGLNDYGTIEGKFWWSGYEYAALERKDGMLASFHVDEEIVASGDSDPLSL